MPREGDPRKMIVLSLEEYSQLFSGKEPLTESNKKLIAWMEDHGVDFNKGRLMRSRHGVTTHTIEIRLDGKFVNMVTDLQDFGTVIVPEE